jgi:hypothetical protein
MDEGWKRRIPMKRAVLGLVAIAVVVVAGSLIGEAGDHAYVGADKCKMCHKVQYASWEATTHATGMEKASADPDWNAADCAKCHATNADESMPGTQCESCHGPGADYKKMSIMKDREKSVANGLIIPSQETCNQCHVDDGHSKAVVLADNLNNPDAIHEFKNPPGE